MTLDNYLHNLTLHQLAFCAGVFVAIIGVMFATDRRLFIWAWLAMVLGIVGMFYGWRTIPYLGS